MSILEQLNLKKKLTSRLRRDGVEKFTIEGGEEGKRARCRSLTRYTDHIVATIDVSLSEYVRR